MTSLRKIESNRRNAQRSTGPRTSEGKLKSSKNAVRHGLLSREITLPDESEDEFDRWSRDLLDRLAPDGALELMLADRVVATAWRLKRACRLESGVLAHRILEATSAKDGDRDVADPLAAGLIRDAAGADALSKLGRYERSLERGLYRALHELQRLQAAAREGHGVPAPAVVDVDISSG